MADERRVIWELDDDGERISVRKFSRTVTDVLIIEVGDLSGTAFIRVGINNIRSLITALTRYLNEQEGK